MKTTVWMTLLASAVLALGIAACGDDEDDTNTDAAGGSGGTAADAGGTGGETTDTDSACVKCVKEKCTAELTACNALEGADKCKGTWECILGKYNATPATCSATEGFAKCGDDCEVPANNPDKYSELESCASTGVLPEGAPVAAKCATECGVTAD